MPNFIELNSSMHPIQELINVLHGMQLVISSNWKDLLISVVFEFYSVVVEFHAILSCNLFLISIFGFKLNSLTR